MFEIIAPYRERIKIEKTGWEVEVTDFYPEAGMEGPGKLVQTGYQLNNPAIRVKVYQGGKEKSHFWQVFQYPEIQMSKIEGLKVIGKTVDPIAFSVFQVGYDPGVPLALLGSVIVIIGVFSAFYLYFRKLWVQVTPLGQGSRIRLAGISKRHRVAFEVFFKEVAGQLRAATKAKP